MDVNASCKSLVTESDKTKLVDIKVYKLIHIYVLRLRNTLIRYGSTFLPNTFQITVLTYQIFNLSDLYVNLSMQVIHVILKYKLSILPFTE